MSIDTTDIDVPTPVPTLPDLAKMPAVNRLASALTARGLRENTAEAIAVAVCDPSEARRQLEQPATLRVSGGKLEVIYVDVWTPSILLFPENPRMLPYLTYAVESHEGRRRPLPPANPDSTSPELVMEPVTSAELVEHLDAQVNFLRDNNDLYDSIGSYGIQEPLLLVGLAFEGLSIGNDLPAPLDVDRDDDEWPTILTSVDGNSRLAAAYRHLGLEPSEVVTKLVGSSRAIRQRVGVTLARQRPGAAKSVEADEALRALTAPAAIVVGFVPEVAGRDLLDGLQSRLGAIHVAPPKPWSSASKFDLLLNVALDALQSDLDSYSSSVGVKESAYREWLAGNLTTAEAENAGLDPQPDFRAVALRWWFRKSDQDVSIAIRSLDIAHRVTAPMLASIAAEGALRSFRSAMTATEADNARRVLSALYQLEDLKGEWSTDDTVGAGSISALTREAIAEVIATRQPGPNARVLMLLAFYWLTRYRVVPLQTRGGQADRRKMVDVVTMMCRTEHGLRVLAQVVEDGRGARAPRAVGKDGKIETKNGQDVLLSDDWIRRTWSKGRRTAVADSPQADLINRSEELAELIKEVVGAMQSLRVPSAGDGLPLVDTVGLSAKIAAPMLRDLEEIRDDLIELRLISKRANPAGTEESSQV